MQELVLLVSRELAQVQAQFAELVRELVAALVSVRDVEQEQVLLQEVVQVAALVSVRVLAQQ